MVDGVHAELHKSGKLRRGDLLLAVDGKAIEDHIREAARFVSASTDSARRWSSVQTLPLAWKRPTMKVRIRRLDADKGKELELELACTDRKAVVPSPAVLSTKRTLEMLDGGFAYFRPGSFLWPKKRGWVGAEGQKQKEILKESFAETRQTMEKIIAAESSALILDLRGNPGGTDLLGMALAAHLVGPKTVYFRLQARRIGRIWGIPGLHRPQTDGEPRFHGRLVCLIDARTFSTANNFSACMRDTHPDVIFIGRPDGAGTGAPRPVTLPHTGAKVAFCTQRVFSPKNHIIEGVGVKPDILIRWSRDDLLKGRDPDLAAALKHLRAGKKKDKDR